jgi:hypothetical protein
MPILIPPHLFSKISLFMILADDWDLTIIPHSQLSSILLPYRSYIPPSRGYSRWQYSTWSSLWSCNSYAFFWCIIDINCGWNACLFKTCSDYKQEFFSKQRQRRTTPTSLHNDLWWLQWFTWQFLEQYVASLHLLHVSKLSLRMWQ